MGWLEWSAATGDVIAGHEGYFCAVERSDDGLWREIRYPDDRPRPVAFLRVGCDCGWRSKRFRAPEGTTWEPFSVWVRDELLEEVAREIWRGHLEELVADHHAECSSPGTCRETFRCVACDRLAPTCTQAGDACRDCARSEAKGA